LNGKLWNERKSEMKRERKKDMKMKMKKLPCILFLKKYLILECTRYIILTYKMNFRRKLKNWVMNFRYVVSNTIKAIQIDWHAIYLENNKSKHQVAEVFTCDKTSFI